MQNQCHTYLNLSYASKWTNPHEDLSSSQSLNDSREPIIVTKVYVLPDWYCEEHGHRSNLGLGGRGRLFVPSVSSPALPWAGTLSLATSGEATGSVASETSENPGSPASPTLF